MPQAWSRVACLRTYQLRDTLTHRTMMMQPETHFVRARTDEAWRKTNPEGGEEVVGRAWWPSPPHQLNVAVTRRALALPLPFKLPRSEGQWQGGGSSSSSRSALRYASQRAAVG